MSFTPSPQRRKSPNNSTTSMSMTPESQTINTKSSEEIKPDQEMKPLMVENSAKLGLPNGDEESSSSSQTDFYYQALRFGFCFIGLQLSYLTWGYMQELIMTTTFEPTPSAPDGKFPSAAFCVFSNRFLAILVAIVAVRMRKGAVLANNVAPLVAFAPCALSNTMSSWSQYASLRYVSFPVQTVFKSSKIIPVMIMGKVLKGTNYPMSQYVEALLITIGVAVFSIASKSSDSDTSTEVVGLLFMCLYVTFDCFTSQWQDKIYVKYGRANVDPYQMMLGVNSSAILMTTAGLVLGGDIPKIIEFFKVNPTVFQYNVITAITSASGQLFIYTTIKEFGPIVFTVIMTTRQMISICISSILFGHTMGVKALIGAGLVFGVLFYQIRKKYLAKKSGGGR
jgi:adenosine 3'-phospho 5'-phosphosulfate transporter B2